MNAYKKRVAMVTGKLSHKNEGIYLDLTKVPSAFPLETHHQKAQEKKRSSPKRTQESSEHKELKAIGLEFLKGLSCQQIAEEYRARGNSMVIDMLGRLDGKKIALECGGSSPKKLKKLNNWADWIYILPYGETKPYLWQSNIKICKTCGHKINGVKA